MDDSEDEAPPAGSSARQPQHDSFACLLGG